MDNQADFDPRTHHEQEEFEAEKEKLEEIKLDTDARVPTLNDTLSQESTVPHTVNEGLLGHLEDITGVGAILHPEEKLTPFGEDDNNKD